MGDKLQAVVENMLEEVRAHAQAERAAALTQAAVETCGYCNPKNMLNLVGEFDATGRNHVTPSGDLEPCKAWQIRALITPESQSSLDEALRKARIQALFM